MKRILGIAFALFFLSAAPAFAVCTTLQLKDNAGATPNALYRDDGAGNCLASSVISGAGGANTAAVLSAGADATSNSTGQLISGAFGYFYNGTTWDRMRGDTTNGLFVNVKAGNITQIGGAVPSATNPLWMAAAQATVSAGNSLNGVTANTTGSSIPMTGFGGALVNINCSVNCTGGTTVTVQGSDVVGFQNVGFMPVAGASAMVTSVVNQSGAAFFCVPNFGYTNLRAVVSSYSAGTISATITPINGSACDVTQIANALASVQANNGSNGAASTNTTPVTEQNGSAYPNHANWTSGKGSGTSTGAITVISAPGANSLYVKSVQCGRDDAGTTAVRVDFNDANTTPMVLPNSGGGGGNNMTFDPPLKIAATTAFTATPSAGTTTIRCSAQAFIAP